MIPTDVINKTALKTMTNPLCLERTCQAQLLNHYFQFKGSPDRIQIENSSK